MTGLKTVYFSSLAEKMQMTFKMFDFDDDGSISKEDVRILLSYVSFRSGRAKSPIETSPTKEGMYDARDKDYNERTLEQDKILMFLGQVFEHQESISFVEYDRINREVSSEMFYSLMFTLHEKLPCTQNFFKLKRDYRDKNSASRSP